VKSWTIAFAEMWVERINKNFKLENILLLSLLHSRTETLKCPVYLNQLKGSSQFNVTDRSKSRVSMGLAYLLIFPLICLRISACSRTVVGLHLMFLSGYLNAFASNILGPSHIG
jgi:hypothetical protein